MPAAQPPRPVLCFLHGYDEAASSAGDEGVSRYGPLRPGNPALVAEQFLIVAPQLPYPGDTWQRYADEVRERVASAVAQHAGDAARLYLTGFSFGGNGVFDLALLQPDFWAALWPVDPTRVPKQDPGVPVWLSVGEVARRRKLAFIQALRLEPAQAAADRPRVYLDQSDNHVRSAVRAYGDAAIYAWLLRWRR